MKKTKKSTVAMFIVLFAAIPLTIYFGSKLPGRSYYLLSALIAIEILIPFFLSFEGRKPQPRELVTIAVMAALVTIARVAVPLPSFKPTFAMILLSGVAFGPETGFLIGAVGALGSDFFYGQGPFTPWQMMAYGSMGLIGGFAHKMRWLPRKRIPMAVFCFLATVLFVGPLLDTSTVFLTVPVMKWQTIAPLYLSGFPVNISQGTCSAITIFLFGEAILEKLDRIKLQYGVLEDQ